MASAAAKSLNIGHINLHHSKLANIQLNVDVKKRKLNILSLNEPYFNKNIITDFSSDLKIYFHPEAPRSAILVDSSVHNDCLAFRSRDVVAITFEHEGLDCFFITSYTPPSEPLDSNLRIIDSLISRYFNRVIILCGDFNAKSTVWGPSENRRGADLNDFFVQHQLIVINDPNGPPTFNSVIGKSWIDVICTTDPETIRNFLVDDTFTASDHELITFVLTHNATAKKNSNPSIRYKSLHWIDLRVKLLQLIGCYNIEEVNTTDDLDVFIESFTKDMIKICQSVRLKYRQHSGLHNPWWNPKLEIQRSKVRALRRRFQKERNQQLREKLKMNFKGNAALYKRMIYHYKRESFRNYIESLSNNECFGKPYHIAKGEDIRRHVNIATIKPNGEKTDNFLDSIVNIFQHHFPLIDDEEINENEGCNLESLITFSELESVIRDLKPNKAPGEDGIPSEIIRDLYYCDKAWFRAVINKCWTLSYFPKVWKNAKICLIPKPGKDLEKPESYRPISLLATWGKVLDKIVTRRLTFFLEDNGLLHEMQFGFRRGKGTEDALRTVLAFVDEAHNDNEHVVAVALDIQNAFNSARWSIIVNEMIRLNVPFNVINIVRSFLGDRSATFVNNNFKYSKQYNIGVPQGSSLGPILWLMIINTALAIFHDPNVKLVAFADDLLLLVKSSTFSHFGRIITDFLDVLKSWAARYSLKFSVPKTQCISFPKDSKKLKKVSGIKMSPEENISSTYTLKYLGFTLDPRLNWTAHLNALVEKIRKFNEKIRFISRATWGLRPEILKHMYLQGTERIITYGASVWFSKKVRIVKKLLSVQRIPLLTISRAYRTTSTEALQILTGIKPIDLKIIDEIVVKKIQRRESTIALLNREWKNLPIMKKPGFIHPAETIIIPWDYVPPTDFGWELFTDGSRTVEVLEQSTNPNEQISLEERTIARVGCSVVAKYNGVTTFTESYRLDDHATVFQAELSAIKLAFEWATEQQLKEVTIFSDSRSSLMALNNPDDENTLVFETKRLWKESFKLSWIKAHIGLQGNEEADLAAKFGTELPSINIHIGYSTRQIKTNARKITDIEWQERWDNPDAKGRHTYEIFPVVSTKRLFGDFFLNQILTNHGVWGTYQQRFFKRTAACRYCGSHQDIKHLILNCTKFKELRGTTFNQKPEIVDWMKSRKCKEIIIRIVKETLDDLFAPG